MNSQKQCMHVTRLTSSREELEKIPLALDSLEQSGVIIRGRREGQKVVLAQDRVRYQVVVAAVPESKIKNG